MQYTDYAAFNPTIAQLTNIHLVLYQVPSKCFGLSTSIIRDIANTGIQQWHILLNICISLTESDIIVFLWAMKAHRGSRGITLIFL
jgi:hypothetical protein